MHGKNIFTIIQDAFERNAGRDDIQFKNDKDFFIEYMGDDNTSWVYKLHTNFFIVSVECEINIEDSYKDSGTWVKEYSAKECTLQYVDYKKRFTDEKISEWIYENVCYCDL